MTPFDTLAVLVLWVSVACILGAVLGRVFRLGDPERECDPATAWDDYLSDGLAAWARDTVPEQDRDLGQLAEWAATVTDRRAA